jgi:hypothetical protein
MWQLQQPKPVKLIVGILAADECCLEAARQTIVRTFGEVDMTSPVYPFDMTTYYEQQAGPSILRQFVTLKTPIDPGQLAEIKHTANRIEMELAESLATPYPRPVNLDPGYIEPSKLVLASTKNFAHRIYIGSSMWAEVTLTYNKGLWQVYPYTFPDFKSGRYNDFLSQVREKLAAQRRTAEQAE